MIKSKQQYTENLLSDLGGSNLSAWVEHSSVAEDLPVGDGYIAIPIENPLPSLGGANSDAKEERVSVATNPPVENSYVSVFIGDTPPEPIGRWRDEEKENRPARQESRRQAIADSIERGRQEAEGNSDGLEEHKAIIVEDFLAAQAEKDANIDDKYVVPWLLTQSTGYYTRQVDGEVIYYFLDGPENQHYGLKGVPIGFVYNMLPKHNYVCKMKYEGGKRVLLKDHSEVGKVLGKDWAAEEGAQDAWLDKAVEAVIPHVVGSKFDSETHSLTNRALVYLSDTIKPWPGAREKIAQRLRSPSFMDKVVQYHRERRVLAPAVVEARLNVLGGSILASDGDIEEALKRIKNEKKFRHHYLAYFLLFLFVLNVFFELYLHAFWVLVALGVLVFLKTRRRRFDESKVATLVESFNSGGSRARFASVLSLAPSCSGLLRQEPGLVNGEGGYKVKVKFSPGLEPCKDLKPYTPYGSIITAAPMVVPACCHHDINNAAAIRFLFPREQRTDLVRAVIGHAQEWLLPLFKRNKSQWWYVSRSEWLSHLQGKRRAMLVNEPVAVNLWGQNPIDAFVKREAYCGKTPESFKPRMIMGRKLGYQNVVGHYMYSVSKFVGRVLNINTDTFYVSGNSPAEVGEFATSLFTKKKYVYESDVSNWDGSLHPFWRDFEIWFIENCVPAECPRWAEVKAMWKNTVVQGPKGFQMKTNFCRHSGDMWTSFMNSIINLAIVKFVAPDALAGVLGDDNFWGTDSEISVEEVVSMYQKIGMKVELIKRPSIEQLEFCSGRFYLTDKGYVWGVKPFRLLAKFGLNLNRRKNHRELLYGTALSMLPVANHVPLIGEVLRGIVESGCRERLVADYSDGWTGDWRMRDTQVFDPSPASYAQFQTLYSLTHSEMADLFNVVQIISKMGLDAFPMSLDGMTWLKGFDVDCGTQSSRLVATQPLRDETLIVSEPIPWVPLLVAPVLEESLKHCWPWLAIVFGVLERRWANLALHCVTAFIGKVSFPAAVALHAFYNYRVWRNNVDYDRRMQSNYADTVRSLLTEGGLFRSMLDCSPSLNTKDNKLLVLAFSGWNTLCKNFSFKNTKKKGTKPRKNNNPSRKKQKGSLGRSLLTGGLGALGGLLGPAGARVGASLGDWGSTMLGMGDYSVDKNSLDHGQGVPVMHNGHKSMRISHRELLTDITGSTAFASRKFVINPGAAQTFPWLSGMSKQFQSYKIHGLAFEFVSTSADALNSVNTALGSVIMATQYNVSLPDFTSKAQMAQYEFSCTTRPSRSLVHLVECDPKLQVMDHLYTRDGALPAGADYQFYDWGNFYLATVGMQAAATIGELWVTYDIEFFKPRIDGSGSYPGDFTRISNGPFSLANPLGDIQRDPVGNLGVTIASSGAGFGRIYFPPTISAGRYMVSVAWKYASGSLVLATSSQTNLTPQPTWELGQATYELAYGSNRTIYTTMCTVDTYSPVGSYIDLSFTSLPASPATVDVIVVALPLRDAAF